MIEIVKENGVPVEKIINKRETPINLKAVGDPEGNEKIYMEDYVDTFIKQIAGKDDDPKVLILYGETKKEEDQTTHFVYGAVLAEEIAADEKTVFEYTIWKDVNKNAAHFFPNTQIMGWVYIRYDLADFAGEKVMHTHKQFFRSDQKVYIEYSAVDKKECVFLVSDGKLEKQSGHYIYYESNEAMQNYMVTIKQEEPEEVKPEVDRAAKKSRAIVREKKEEIKHRQTMGMLYGSSMAMLLVVTIVGVTLLNNYNKMQSMEKVLNDISDQMSDEGSGELILTENENLYAANTDSGEINKPEAMIADFDTETTEEETSPERETELSKPPENESVTESDLAVTETDEQPGLLETGNEEKVVLTNEEEESIMSVDTEMVDNASLDEEVPDIYMIQKGDTLSQISIRFYGNENKVDQICELNNIPDKNTIKYGINIVLP